MSANFFQNQQLHSLVKYGNPVLVSTSGKKGKDDKKGKDKKSLEQ